MAAAIFNLDDPTQYPAGVSYSPAVANDPGAIQSALIARLQAKQVSLAALAGVEIAAFPDDPESWRAVNQIGTVLVRYEGSEYGDIEDTGEVAQERKMRFRLGMLARGLGWSDSAGVAPQGGYAILQACLTALLGYKVPGGRKIYAERDEFVRRDRQGGVWIYALDIIAPTYVVEPPDPETLPNFTLGTVNLGMNGGSAIESPNTQGQP